mgnify:CR=1 FL=1
MNTKYTLAWMYLCFFTSIMVGYGQKPPSVNQQYAYKHEFCARARPVHDHRRDCSQSDRQTHGL